MWILAALVGCDAVNGDADPCDGCATSPEGVLLDATEYWELVDAEMGLGLDLSIGRCLRFSEDDGIERLEDGAEPSNVGGAITVTGVGFTGEDDCDGSEDLYAGPAGGFVYSGENSNLWILMPPDEDGACNETDDVWWIYQGHIDTPTVADAQYVWEAGPCPFDVE